MFYNKQFRHTQKKIKIGIPYDFIIIDDVTKSLYRRTNLLTNMTTIKKKYFVYKKKMYY